MLKVCIDTNVWLSGIVFSGPPSEIVSLALSAKIQVITSVFILGELQKNLTGKFGVTPKKAHSRFDELRCSAHLQHQRYVGCHALNHERFQFVVDWIGRQ